MIPDGRTEFTAHGVRLREMARADAQLLYGWRNDPTSRQGFRTTAPIAWDDHLAFVERYLQPSNRDRWFIIEETGRPVGAIALYAIDASGAEAEWGRFVVEPTLRGQGTGRRALQALLDYARTVGFRRLTCEVIAGNRHAEGLYLSLGFREESTTTEGGRIVRRLALDLAPSDDAEPIHLFVPTFRTDEVLHEIRDCLERGWTGLGYKTVDFEAAFSRYTGLPYVHFLNSASSGLHLAVKLLAVARGWAPDDEVITTPLTFVSTNHAILYEGLRPVFADVDEHLCLDPASVAERITPRTRALIFVGMGGNVGRWDEIRDLCRERGIALILDAAHMTGTRVGGRHVGWDADVAVFSFQAVKNLPTADSGAICFATEELDAAARRWSWMGINKDTYSRTLGGGTYRWLYDVEDVGYKYHGNAVMAAMALVGLRHVDQDNAYRRQLATWYDAELADATAVERVPIAPACEPSRHLYQVVVRDRDRDEVIVAMNRQGVFPGVHYRDNTLYRMYASADGTCPRARDASARLISLPMHLRLTSDHVARVARVLRTSADATP